MRKIFFCIVGALIALVIDSVIFAELLSNVHSEEPTNPVLALAITLTAIGMFVSPYFGCMYGVSIAESQAEKAKREKEQEAKRNALRRAQRAEQRSLRDKAKQLVTSSQENLEHAPSLLEEVENQLDIAEFEFNDGAFAPFWDAIENTINLLSQFDASVVAVVRNYHTYENVVSNYQGGKSITQFTVDVDRFPDPNKSSKRMIEIVRRAQKDFQFATIYEQRKTNKLLASGFASLADAITGIGDRLDASIESLAYVVSDGFKKQHETMEDQISAINGINQQLSDSNSRRSNHEEIVENMLDNIQRKRRPIDSGNPSDRDGNNG